MPTLDFKGKQIVYAHHLGVPYRTLDVAHKKSVLPKGNGKNGVVEEGNLVVHGDNLQALKALMPRYAGRGAVGKHAILGMREWDGRMKAMPGERTAKPTLQSAVHEQVEIGSKVYTDEHGVYHGLARYDHESVCHSTKEYVRRMMAHINGIESVWAVVERGFDGVYHHWNSKHCACYVDEFAFCLNGEGNCERDTIDRIDDVCRNAVGKRLTYERLIS